MIRVEIIADRKSAADDLARLLEFDGHIEVVATHALAELAAPGLQSDVLLAVNLLSSQIPGRTGPVVVLSDEQVGHVHASLPLHSSPAVLVAAITAAAADLYTLTSDQVHLASAQRDDASIVEKLTAREIQVLNLISEGLSNKEIAGDLRISRHTAKFHVGQVLAKLGAGSRTEAVRIGLRRGLLAL